MTRPAKYTKTTGFLNYARLHQGAEYNAADHDTEFDNLQRSLGETQDFLAGFTRADGRINAASIDPEMLSNQTLALVGTKNLLVRGGWTTETIYSQGDLISYNDASYICMIYHRSGTFNSDKANGYWMLLANNAITGYPSHVDKWIGNGTLTDFTLSYYVNYSSSLIVAVDGLVQLAEIDYTIINGGTTLHFASAPPASGGYNVFAVFSSTATGSAEVGLAAEQRALCEQIYDQFDDRYLGAKANDPSTDNDGAALLLGALYWNTQQNRMRVFNGAIWNDMSNVTLNMPADYGDLL